jgi:hypothetical protein
VPLDEDVAVALDDVDEDDVDDAAPVPELVAPATSVTVPPQ